MAAFSGLERLKCGCQVEWLCADAALVRDGLLHSVPPDGGKESENRQEPVLSTGRALIQKQGAQGNNKKEMG